jgi:hypothetical protein
LATALASASSTTFNLGSVVFVPFVLFGDLESEADSGGSFRRFGIVVSSRGCISDRDRDGRPAAQHARSEQRSGDSEQRDDGH